MVHACQQKKSELMKLISTTTKLNQPVLHTDVLKVNLEQKVMLHAAGTKTNAELDRTNCRKTPRYLGVNKTKKKSIL